jgi:pimeloyl-ACP methyl ester carboxylesterase
MSGGAGLEGTTSMTHAELCGISIAYDDLCARGETTGKPVLLLIHGHPLDRSMWRPQAEAAVAAGWRVILPDLRGYGETSVVPGKTTLEALANDLAGLLDLLGVRRVIVGGLSMGGQIAMEFARLYPERLDGLLLAATFPRVDTNQGRRQRIELADRLEREGMSAYADELLPRMLSRSSITALPHVAEHVRSMMRQAPPMGSAAALRGRAERPPYESVLARLEIPALIVVGDEDPFTTRDDAEQMHQLLRQSRLQWMPGVGHMPNLERPEEFNAALVAFLAAVPTGIPRRTR